MGRRSGTASKALVRRRIRPGGGEGWRNRPPAAWPKGNAAGGFGPDAEGMVDMPAGRCFGDLFLRAGKGLRTTRRMPGASCPSSNVWRWYGRSGFTPKRAPIPASDVRRGTGCTGHSPGSSQTFRDSQKQVPETPSSRHIRHTLNVGPIAPEEFPMSVPPGAGLAIPNHRQARPPVALTSGIIGQSPRHHRRPRPRISISTSPTESPNWSPTAFTHTRARLPRYRVSAPMPAHAKPQPHASKSK